MNGLGADLAQLDALKRGLESPPNCDVLVCPPASRIARAAMVVKNAFALGAQDCHEKASGAFTGDISAEMLKDAGASAVIVGHSERRQYHHETDTLVRAKAEAARRAGLTAIVCVGETHAEHRAGRTVEVVSGQLRGSLPPRETPHGLVVAYEPVWAIGTGIVPTAAYVAQCHVAIRELLGELYGAAGGRGRILYGGSVKPSNARELLRLPNVDGALVGGASLKAADFMAIVAGCYA